MVLVETSESASELPLNYTDVNDSPKGITHINQCWLLETETESRLNSHLLPS